MKELEILYTDRCDIYCFEKIIDEKTKISRTKKVKKYENQPCRVSFKNISNSSQGELKNGITQVIKLFISSTIEIKEGSEIEINRNNRILKYKASGIPAIYSSHQEVILIQKEEEA